MGAGDGGGADVGVDDPREHATSVRTTTQRSTAARYQRSRTNVNVREAAVWLSFSFDILERGTTVHDDSS
jgi:hypothetical protein